MTHPNFFIVGASKCGTTALAEALGGHPDIFVSSPKEPNFFDRADCFSDGADVAAIGRYLSLFESAGGASLVGEGSVSYLASPHAAERISRFAPDAKIIILVRHPVQRSRSLYEMYVRDGYEGSFDEAILHDGFLVDHTYYYESVKRYYDAFPREQILVMDGNELLTDWERSTRAILEFLGVDSSQKLEHVHKNVGGVPRSRYLDILTNRTLVDAVKTLLPRRSWNFVDAKVKAAFFEPIVLTKQQEELLLELYRPDVAALDGLLGSDFAGRWFRAGCAPQSRPAPKARA